MLSVTDAVRLLSEELLSSSGSIFHKCNHVEQIFSDLWKSSKSTLDSKLCNILQLHDQLVFWAGSSNISFPKLPSAFIAFVCDDDEFRCSATQLLRQLGSGGKINLSTSSTARMIVAAAPHCARKIAAWSLECESSTSAFVSSAGPLQQLLTSIHAAASAVAALSDDALFRRRVYTQLIACSTQASNVTTRVRGALAAVPEKMDLVVLCRELFLSLIQALKSDDNSNEPSSATISFACTFVALCQVLCESHFKKQELLSSILEAFPASDTSGSMQAISDISRLFRSLSHSKVCQNLVYESSHPFRCSTHQFDIVFPFACEISIAFDSRTSTDPDWVLKICHESHCTTCCEGAFDDDDSTSSRWPGVGDIPPLAIAGPCFTVKMLESNSDEWGFKFTATASYDHPLIEIYKLLDDAVVNHALQTSLIHERFAFVNLRDAALHGHILRQLDFISEIASDAVHIGKLKHFCEQNAAVFACVLKWVLYFSLRCEDHAATLACYERYFCFFTIARDVIAACHQRISTSDVALAFQSDSFTTQNCVDVFVDREFPFEMSEIDSAAEAVSDLKVSSSKREARTLLSSKARGWHSNGRIGSVRVCIFVYGFMSFWF